MKRKRIAVDSRAKKPAQPRKSKKKGKAKKSNKAKGVRDKRIAKANSINRPSECAVCKDTYWHTGSQTHCIKCRGIAAKAASVAGNKKVATTMSDKQWNKLGRLTKRICVLMKHYVPQHQVIKTVSDYYHAPQGIGFQQQQDLLMNFIVELRAE